MVEKRWLFLVFLLLIHSLFIVATVTSLLGEVLGRGVLTGEPDSWSRATPFLWSAPLIISLGFSILFFFSSLAVRRAGINHPELLSLPMKSQFLKLPSYERVRILTVAENNFFLQSILLFLLIAAMHGAIYLNISKGTSFNTLFLPVFLLYLAALFFSVIHLYRKLKRQIQEAIGEKL